MRQRRREVFFFGWVQGVGFRFRVNRIAAGFDVTGFVRNLPDGRVQVVAEGAMPELDRFFGEIQTALGDHIRRTEVLDSEGAGSFNAFGIVS